MANYEIQNYKGEVISASISQDELNILIENNTEFNSFQYDDDLVERFTARIESGEAADLSSVRIYKKIEE